MTPFTALAVHDAVARDGFAFVQAHEMAGLLASAGNLSGWDDLAASWNDLALDTYMADGGRYRRRRHAVYHAGADGPIVRQPHQPHYQSRNYNALNGGIERWFEPIAASVGASETLGTILTCSRHFFESLTPNRWSAPPPRQRRFGVPRRSLPAFVASEGGKASAERRRWHVEVHQFRIEARAGEIGQPTPEGIHRDGVDYVLVLLIDRVNVRSATTTVHALDGRPLGSFTLAAPLDAAFLDDRRVAHGVTPVEPRDPDQPAYRDVLVVTWAEV